MSKQWEFWIDVGGTFTDAIGRAPDGTLKTSKVLSSGVTRGRGGWDPSRLALTDPARRLQTDDFFAGYRLRFLDEGGNVIGDGIVIRHDAAQGTLTLDGISVAGSATEFSYELISPEEAPVLAIRTLLGLPLAVKLPPCRVKLGTTRGTNALLERKGARTAFIINQGFGDLLRIGNQARPKLFELDIRKPEPLFEAVVEVVGRLDAGGSELTPLDVESLRRHLERLQQQGIHSLAVCLLHAWKNPAHELLVGKATREMGFTEISLSHEVAPRIKAVSRGDTTVVDAYLNPVLREYVARIQLSLVYESNLPSPIGRGAGGEGEPSRSSDPHPALSRRERVLKKTDTLQLMTSAGGLVDAGSFRGRDCILSGPAGGVVGYSRVAALAGFSKAIGFDMGGTSTDVSRFDGQFEREFETTKAGVRIVAPMLAIETVAAGGGSICGFDGVSLFVGPHSAGAQPGPACYGAGGPLTVTDCNLALGRLLPERFPFTLDAAVVDRRLGELCDQIAVSPLGERYTPIELAQGFIDIANAHMARAIRQISVARGFDPGEHVLVTFGGAGAQHACALARELGMRQIMIHPLASLLSALGMGLADVRRMRELTVLRECTDALMNEVRGEWQRVADELEAEIIAEGVAASQIDPPVIAFEMRYVGQEATILVRPPDGPVDAGQLRALFEAEHERQFGYRREGRGIELCVVHVERVGRLPEPEWEIDATVIRQPSPSRWADVWFNGEQLRTGVFDRDELHAGDEIAGPAIICEPNSTVVLEPGSRQS